MIVNLIIFSILLHRVSTKFENTYRQTKKAVVRQGKPRLKVTGRRRLEGNYSIQGWKAVTAVEKTLKELQIQEEL